MTRKTREDVTAKALELWQAFSENERFGVRFGMFPAEPMRQAEAEGFTSRDLTLALMDVAARNGGMRA